VPANKTVWILTGTLGGYILIMGALAAYMLALMWAIIQPPAVATTPTPPAGGTTITASMTEMLIRRQS